MNNKFFNNLLKEETIEQQVLKVIKSFTIHDFKLVGKYDRIDECQEVVRLNHGNSVSDPAKPVKVNGVDNSLKDCMFFHTKKDGIMPFFICKQVGNHFELFDLTKSTYNKYF